MTIKDIAALSGYAVGTVSRALNGSPNVSPEAREKILAVVNEHNFKLNNNAKHLKQQASSGIAVIVKGTQNMLFATIIEKMQGLIKERGLASLIYYIDEDDNEVEQAIQVCQERHPMGIMFLGTNRRTFKDGFPAIALPCVLVTNSASHLDFDNLSSVSTDDSAAAEAAIHYLASLGHRCIGILGGQIESLAAFARYDGCLKAFSRLGLDIDPEKQVVSSRFSMSDGYSAMEKLMDIYPELTAVFAMSDVMAMGAIRAVHDRGLRVPEDISVMGFDGIAMGSYLTPQLTTIRQQSDVIARRSVDILLRCIEERSPAVHEVTPFDLIPGESVRAL